MLALAVAYEIQCRFPAAVPVMPKGFNHSTQLAMSMDWEGRRRKMSPQRLKPELFSITYVRAEARCCEVARTLQKNEFFPQPAGRRP
jgi:2-methylcitrate dehydratase